MTDTVHDISTLGGWTGNRYEASGIYSLLQEKVANKKLSQLLKPAFIPSYNAYDWHPMVFDSIRARF